MVKKRILDFALKNWKAILIVSLLLVVALKNRNDYKLMQKAYETQAQSHEAQIEGLKEIHAREIEERRILTENYLESLAAIEKEYEDSLQMIKELREDKKTKYRNKLNSDSEQLIKDIEETFGIEYVP